MGYDINLVAHQDRALRLSWRDPDVVLIAFAAAIQAALIAAMVL